LTDVSRAVSSSPIVSIGYDDASETLEVKFKTGLVYQYLNVPSRIHAQLMSAPSIGGFFNANIRDVLPSKRP
jgi:hypothetical protein